MIPEIGTFALCLALGLSTLLSIYPQWGASRQDERMMAMARPLSYGMFGCILLAFIILVHAFVVNDFSVAYVANNSNTHLPVYYRMAATWGAHEGSLLLWVLLLSCWTTAVALFSRRMPNDAVARVLAVMGLITTGFLLFILLTSNPFLRTLPNFPIDGSDLNPVLQDIGLIFHPPILYMGYVGFSVAFAFAIASLMAGRLDTAWARWSRPWTQAAWVFLTVGIVLGSAWAYYELGWGGWWFWDPVENASFMPWLAGTALIHSLAVTEKRGTFKAWTVLLSITCFSLCLLGTFLVRSGVLVSVHSFASDPARGMFILAYLVIVIGSSLLLYAIKGSAVRAPSRHEPFSRESFLLGNNVLLIAAMLVVLLGTLLPLIHKQLGLGSISIGEPFFNTMFTWLMAPMALLLGIGPLVRWRRDEPSKLWRRLGVALVVTLLLSILLPWLLQDKIVGMTVVGMLMSVWVILLTLMELHERATHRHTFWRGLTHLSRSHWGMVLGHLGVAVTVIGIAFSQNYSVERDVRMKSGDTVDIQGYHFEFRNLTDIKGSNYTGGEANIDVTRNGKFVTVLHAEKRYYSVAHSMMTEAAIDGNLARDLYAALGEELDDGSWAVRLYYKPFVRWIWLGGIFMAVGGILCILDPRYRMTKKLKRQGKEAAEEA
ncbi:heme lyase CcmF/NrfE family subunit [Rouxiella badensis]|jgi:cytochrome c-type biogenesis protein CcmF|uniref:C-type cytochrome biogenesis protein CcmF n=1 Tax=Rouxiella badensis TaxID=1646377 RepID=A0A1X0WCE4_9GAMM|nr:heme lyase CcmF/NrfE family subunit [Rouxiella badensis]MCC3703063.1 heme lyase CcmF/NrfE family subunit [Rouxiella badensis]MCC3721196.1 heme lyase CcmF/NrfE family subunit [Rouxiella badensis]MCC3730909.1 heme lyase CcmF/NrfE family subunit [Rouxiella badensis]MCC3734582.1 heme lyase CcmF/NrfE family subunit [Rouxiella badensis]MCC3742433.1 heme lyase CcmF/NrfE family subunit [Rouxiella badensis]